MIRRVAIVGVGLSAPGAVADRSPFQLLAEASRHALAETGLKPADIDGFASTGLGILPPVEVAEYLGLRPTWVDGTGVGGSTWEVMAAHATDAIAAGHADVVLLAYGSTARSDLKKGLRSANMSFGARGPAQFEAPFGASLVSKYAMAAGRHMHEYGTTIDQLAQVAVDARRWAAVTPFAERSDPIEIADVHAARMIADPLTALHCCLRSDGGAAVILVAEDRLADLPVDPVFVLGSAEHTSHSTMSEWADFTTSPASVTGSLAFERAGVRPEDIDVCQIYDAFTYGVLVTLEDLGFCAKGEGGGFIDEVGLGPAGALPTNTDGGGLSGCHPGMRGLFLLVEAVRQLRGEAGDRQVASPELACVSGTGGWFSSSGTMILGRT
ncbi:acetyl-CoA acetyltransferase [Agrococcus baldri]|uniref:Thiolase n=1 Tax=Agrococcus baldri TaxID=153730 RepID=A0AA87RMG9_9MICO|nr:acetyl-CoA acetyltransferase [Agrococcus baldri]GEK81608.1 thiolase [Agrococcus baldri]